MVFFGEVSQIASISLGTRPSDARYIYSSNSSVTPHLYRNDNASESRPSISIAADSDATVNVNSANMATFTLTASHEPTNTTTVKLMVSESTGGNFVDSTFDKTAVHEIPLATTGTTTPYSVPIADDDPSADVADSTVTVTLLDIGTADPTYTLADPEMHKASVMVSDDMVVVLPNVGITAPAYVIEGDMVTFRIRADTDPTGSDSYAVNFTCDSFWS